MSRFISMLIALLALSLAFDVDARRMGGGRSIGKQRQAITPHQAPRAPDQQQAAPARQAQPAAPAQQPSGMSRWLGPLAGLALGAGLAALFLNNGLAGVLAGLLLLAAIAFGAILLFRLLFRGRSSTSPPLRYAGAGPAGSPHPREPVLAPAPQPLGGTAAPHSLAATMGDAAVKPQLDFDAEQFLRHARTNFINLQAAHDRRDLTSIRDVLTPELYREIEADVRASGSAPQRTEIVTLNAEVADVTTEDDLYVVSVRFSGLIREEPGAEAQPFSELWHLEKPTNGRTGWLVSGIQQV